MSSGRKLYFFDESRVDSWSTKARSWSAKYTNSFVPLNSPMHSLTIYAAVGTGQPVLFFTKGCNSDNLMEFIPILKAGIVSTRSKVKPILVVDQHGSHRKCQPELEKYFQVEYQSPDSCQFNIVETLWSLIKQKYRKTLADDPLRQRTLQQFTDEVKTISWDVAYKHHQAIWRSNIRFIEQHLQVAK